jgi:tetrapyrrole methylase family protein / MazG family protein
MGEDKYMHNESFKRLAEVIDRLLGPNGCPWDKEQTVESLAPALLEEAAEVLEAYHDNDTDHLLDEMGDMAVTLLFLCKVAQKEGKFTWESPFTTGADKLVRRHPHVFGETKCATPDEVIAQWEQVKKQEPFHKKRKNVLDEIPRDLPIVSRCQKIVSRLKKNATPIYREIKKEMEQSDGDKEGAVIKKLALLFFEAEEKGFVVETLLRKMYNQITADVLTLELNCKN